MVKRWGGESLAVDVYARLREDIFNGRYAPGQRLMPNDLRQEFGVSIGVMREALGMLASQKLVRIERNRGFHVVELSAKHLIDLTAARKVNEGAALGLSVRNGSVRWESEVMAAHHKLVALPMLLSDNTPGPVVRNQAWVAAHLEFHFKLISACDNAVLLELCTSLSDAAELYRSWASASSAGADRDTAAEHRALLEAAVGHEANLAVALSEAHVERTAAILLSGTAAGQAPADRRAS